MAGYTCGSCDTLCASGGVCTPTGCAADCTPPLTKCTDRCVNLVTDVDHCGTCLNDCPIFTDAYRARHRTCINGACGCDTCNCADVAQCWQGTCSNLGCSGGVSNGFNGCSNGQCTKACQLGWTMCGNACVFTYTDAANCGACGRACGASELCVASACVPASSTVLATNVTVVGFAQDAGYLYWTDGVSAISRVPKGGGAVQLLQQGQVQPGSLAIDDAFVYWSSTLGGGIFRAPKDGSGSVQVVTATTEPHGIAVDGDQLYWIDMTPDVHVVAKSGGTGTVAVTPKTTFDSQPALGNGAIVRTAHGVIVESGNSWGPFLYNIQLRWSAGLGPYFVTHRRATCAGVLTRSRGYAVSPSSIV